MFRSVKTFAAGEMVVREALVAQATRVRTSVQIPRTCKAKLWQHEPVTPGLGGWRQESLRALQSAGLAN